MPVVSTLDLLTELRRQRLLTQEQLTALSREIQGFRGEAAALARELVRRRWLTTFQASEVLAGRAAGLTLGQYVLLEKLGEGGMGAVYKALHRRMDRLVAVKCIRPELLTGTEAVARFLREVRAAARLSHENVVVVHDADEHNGIHFYVMEYLQGEDLARLVQREGPLSVDRACSCVSQAALGLDHVHAAGLVHRDIKPHNLLLLRDGRKIKLLDLGLALMQTPGPSVTRLGAVMGTLDYMAPEQAQDAHQVDIRADIYALGGTLYHLLAGHPPFPGGNAMQKLAWHLAAKPRPLTELRPDVPPELWAIVERMLAKRPADRFSRPAEVASALAPFVREPRPAPAETSPQETLGPTVGITISPTEVVGEPTLQKERTASRPRLRLGLVAALLLLPLGWLVFSALVGRKKEPGQEQARGQPTPIASTTPVTRPAPNEKAGPYVDRALRALEARKPEEALRELNQAIAIDPNYPLVYRWRARAHLDLRQLDQALADCKESIARDRKEDLETTWLMVAEVHAARHEWDRQAAAYGQAIALNPSNPLYYEFRACALLRPGKPELADAALADIRKAQELFERKKEQRVSLWRYLGHALWMKRQFPEARKALDQALLMEGKDVWTLHMRSRVLLGLQLHREALQDCDRAVEAEPERMEVYRHRAWLLRELAATTPAKAADYLRLALGDINTALSKEKDDVASLFERGRIHLELKNWTQAEADFSRVLEKEPRNHWAYQNRGVARFNLGRKAEADEDFKTAEKLR